MWLFQQFGEFLNLSFCKEYPSMPRAKTPKNSSSLKQQAAAAPGNGANGSKTNFTPAELEAEIRRRAYELYERRGCTPGHEHEDWLVAEQEIVSRYHQGA
jgi:hypothetical protein